MINKVLENEVLEEEVARLLIEKRLTISTAESCTGGMVAARLINYPGISKVFLEGFITYSNEAKNKRLGVSMDTLNKYGAVSEQTAYEMAQGVCKASGSDVSIVTTGIAGPSGGTDKKPVGLVYIGVCIQGEVIIEKHIFKGTRGEVRLQSALKGIDLLRRNLIKR